MLENKTATLWAKLPMNHGTGPVIGDMLFWGSMDDSYSVFGDFGSEAVVGPERFLI